MNYGYANSVMERVCEERQADGYPGNKICIFFIERSIKNVVSFLVQNSSFAENVFENSATPKLDLT